jgi:hypothetical protein
MASVVSTVAAGLETPDFLELRKTTTAPVRDEGGNRQLYSVLPEKQTSVRGLMGSERGYDISGVSGAVVPVLKEDRGTKVRCRRSIPRRPSADLITSPTTAQGWRRGRFVGRERDRGSFGRRAAQTIRRTVAWECGSARARTWARGLFGNGREGDGEEAAEDGG